MPCPNLKESSHSKDLDSHFNPFTFKNLAGVKEIDNLECGKCCHHENSDPFWHNKVMDKPNCMKCKHYHSTYDPKSPRGCKIYGFKSFSMPSVMVKNETGEDCKAFELQKHLEKKQDPFDFNRKDYW